MAYTGSDLCALEAHQVVALLKAGKVSPAELIAAAGARMDQVEPAVNAIPVRCDDRARACAAALIPADHPGNLARDQACDLAGLPIGIKDLTPVAGVRSTYGSKALSENVPKDSDVLVTRLEARGALVMGKTNTPEFGAGGNTFNEVFGATLNPYDTRLNAGGSSGGAAVTLATGALWLSHGSDHGGSLRTPAAYCGVVGLRTTPGLVAKTSVIGFVGEGVEGPMARSVRDCALFLDAMCGYDARSPLSFPPPEQPYQTTVETPVTPRIGWAPDLGGFAPVDADMARYLSRAMGTIERAGLRWTRPARRCQISNGAIISCAASCGRQTLPKRPNHSPVISNPPCATTSPTDCH